MSLCLLFCLFVHNYIIGILARVHSSYIECRGLVTGKVYLLESYAIGSTLNAILSVSNASS